MPVILVVEQDEGVLVRLRQAVGEDGGWRVRHVRSVREAMERLASEAPDLFVVSTQVTGASSLLGPFARRQGGPGALALLPASEGGAAASEDLAEAGLGADAALAKPVTGEQMLEAAREILGVGTRPAESQVQGASKDEPKLTSNDIFGDLVAEVEREGVGTESREQEPPEAGTDRPPAPPVRPSSRPDRPPSPPRRLRSDDDIERRLEQTLSGVLSPSGSRSGRRDRPAAPSGEGGAGAEGQPGSPSRSTSPSRGKPGRSGGADVDALLSRTLSGLELPRRKKPSPPPAPEEPSEPPPSGLSPADATPDFDLSEGLSELEETSFEPPEPPPPAEAPVSEDVEPDEERRVYDDSGTDLGADLLEEEGSEELPPPPSPPSSSPPPIPFEPRFADTLEEAPEPVGEVGAAGEAPVEGGQGVSFGQYRLLERIGVGGMAEVWKARMTGVEGFQKTVAIKKILPHLTDSSDFVDMFVDEAKLAAQLNHANIIHIYDLGRIEGDYYIAMEYVEGENLRAILEAARERGRPLPVGLALYVAARLASGLDYAHKKRDFEDRSLDLVHRDVSPQNVLIGYEGTIKLCDFGIVKAVSKSSHTRMGALKGKLQYMSPEQAWGRKVDGRSDTFSIGALMFEMLTGRRLFTGDSEMEVLEAVRECRVQAPGEVDPSVPEQVDAIVLEALARSPDDRFQSAGELARRLEEVLVSMRPSPGQGELAAYMRELFHREDQLPPTPETVGGPDQPTVPGPEEPEEELSASGAVGEAAPRDSAPASTETGTAAAAPALEAVEPVAEVEPEEGGGRGKGILVAAILVALLAAALLYWFVWRTGGEAEVEGPAEPPSAAAAPEEAPREPGAATNPGAETPEGSSGEQGTEADAAEAASVGAAAAAAVPSAGQTEEETAEQGEAALPSGVAERLEEELARKEEELRQEFEAKQRELTRRIEETQGRAAEPDPPEVGADEADLEPAADDEPSRSAPTAAPNEEPGSEGRSDSAEIGGKTEETGGPDGDDESAGGSAAAARASRAGGSPAGDPGAARAAAGRQAGGRSDARSESTGSGEDEGAGGSTGSTGTEESTSPPEPAAPPEPSVEVGELVRMGPGVVPPKLVTFAKPEYPPIARRLRAEGTVVVSVLVDENGEVVDARLEERVQRKVGLNEAALDAARRARYRPATKDGVRVKMWTTLKIPFRL